MAKESDVSQGVTLCFPWTRTSDPTRHINT